MGSAIENPRAFPRQLDGDELHISSTQCGMTLRDWFAGQAIGSVIRAMQAGFIADHPVAGGGPTGFAATAYDIADAMLATRTSHEDQ